jgi:hypothetical protein
MSFVKFFPNEVSMEDDPLVEASKENPTYKQKLTQFMKGCKSILKNYMLKKSFGDPITSKHYVEFFYCVNHNKEVDASN